MGLWDTFYPPMDWEANRKSWPHTSHSRFVTVHKQIWHVQTFGTGPVLLLLHGTGASTHSWRDLVLTLAQNHTVICPDLPGHAFSYWNTETSNSLGHMATSLADLLNHLKLWPSTVVGHSAGAAVGAQLILQHAKSRPTTLIGLNPAWLPLTGLASWLFPSTAKLLALNPLSGACLPSRQPNHRWCATCCKAPALIWTRQPWPTTKGCYRRQRMSEAFWP